LSVQHQILTRKVRIEKINCFKDSIPNFISRKYLYDFGFRYDEEDGIWYDEHPERELYRFRAHITSSLRVDLYIGGFDKKIGYYFDYKNKLKPVKPFSR